MSSASASTTEARERIRQIFRYLKALHQHRSPAKLRLQDQLWFRWFSDFPEHPSIEIGRRDATEEGSAATNFMLRVKRPKPTQAPAPPAALEDWLADGWDDPREVVALRPKIERLDDRGESVEIRFEDDAGRVEARSRWQPRRDAWAETEKPARDAMKVFEAIFALWGMIRRESGRVELVVGDGILRWQREMGDIHHPILLQRVELEFDADAPEFRIVEADFPPEFYISAFPPGDDFDARFLTEFQRELSGGAYHPLSGKDTSAFLNSIVTRLSPQGEFAESRPRVPKGNNPILGRDPVLFLRPRSEGFTFAVDQILKALDESNPVPSSLVRVVGIEKMPGGPGPPRGAPADILFSGPANPEQYRVAEQLETHDAVLVQGPPGTGKSHTIANLIGHLLAKGQSILVTSHTTKALRVLRRHVVETLRPLCVSVLDRDTDSRQQLEQAVSAIVSKLTTSDEQSLLKEGRTLRAKWSRRQKELVEIEAKIRTAREAEYRPIGIGGESITPAEAAQWLDREKECSSWLPGPLARSAPSPLCNDDVAFLYKSNELLTEQDELECQQDLPDPAGLLSPGTFADTVSQLADLEERDIDAGRSFWTSRASSDTSEMVASILGELKSPVS